MLQPREDAQKQPDEEAQEQPKTTRNERVGGGINALKDESKTRQRWAIFRGWQKPPLGERLAHVPTGGAQVVILNT